MKNRNQLRKILQERFKDDPVALQAAYESMAREDDEERKKLEDIHKQAVDDLKKSHTEELKKRDAQAVERHKLSLKEAREAALSVTELTLKNHEKNSTKDKEHDKSLDKLESKLLKRFDTRLDTHSKQIQRFSEFAVGAPNRSFYVAGTIVSGRYSDVNLIAGTGVTITTADDEQTMQAGVTISATGGGGGLALLVPTSGIVNGVNRTFVFTKAPQIVVLDNANTMNQQNITPDSTVNWTGTTTIILNQPPNFNIFALG